MTGPFRIRDYSPKGVQVLDVGDTEVVYLGPRGDSRLELDVAKVLVGALNAAPADQPLAETLQRMAEGGWEVAVSTASHTFDPDTLVCSHCGATAELLEWKGEPIECCEGAVLDLKRDRYFFDLGRSSRDEEVRDLELKVICLESLLLRSQNIEVETTT